MPLLLNMTILEECDVHSTTSKSRLHDRFITPSYKGFPKFIKPLKKYEQPTRNIEPNKHMCKNYFMDSRIMEMLSVILLHT